MWRRTVFLLAFVLMVTSCGTDAIEEFTGVNREIPEPKSAWATTVPPACSYRCETAWSKPSP